MTQQNKLIFLGDSLTAFHDWSAFGKHHNGGIAGDTTDGLLQHLHYTLEKNPKCVVLMIGINDLLQGRSIESVKKNYLKIFERLAQAERVVILSLLPVESTLQTFEINEKVILLNHFLRYESGKRDFLYLDLYRSMVDRDGGLKKALTSDGVHLTTSAYRLWERALKADLITY